MAILTKDTREGNEFLGKLKTITDERVYAFSGGYPRGPEWPKKTIHTNLDFARNCGLPKRMASGAMFEGYLTELMINLFGENWLKGGKMTLKFIAIVSPGDTLLTKTIVKTRHIEDERIIFELEVWCENQRGNKVVIGAATGIL